MVFALRFERVFVGAGFAVVIFVVLEKAIGFAVKEFAYGGLLK